MSSDLDAYSRWLRAVKRCEAAAFQDEKLAVDFDHVHLNSPTKLDRDASLDAFCNVK